MDEERLRALLQKTRDAGENATSAGTHAEDLWLIHEGLVETRVLLPTRHGGPRTDYSPLLEESPPSSLILVLTQKGEERLAQLTP